MLRLLLPVLALAVLIAFGAWREAILLLAALVGATASIFFRMWQVLTYRM